MQYILLILVLFLSAFSAPAQSLPQGASPIVIREMVTNDVAKAAPGEMTNQAVISKISFLVDAGIKYTDEGEYTEAERAYLHALESAPGNSDIRFRLGTLYIQMERYRDAVKLLEELATEDPDNPMIQNNLAWVYATGGEMRNGKLAVRHAREAILTVPYAPSAWNTLAEAYYVSGQYDKALSSSEMALDLLRMQEDGSKETLSAFEMQRAKIQRAKDSYKTFFGLDKDERP